MARLILNEYTVNDEIVPNITGDLTSASIGETPPVTIEVWEFQSGGTVLLTLLDDECTEIGSTGFWGWSISNLPASTSKKPIYLFKMSSVTGTEFVGLFSTQNEGRITRVENLDDSIGTIL